MVSFLHTADRSCGAIVSFRKSCLSGTSGLIGVHLGSPMRPISIRCNQACSAADPNLVGVRCAYC